ncbi:MAG: CRISPR-associated endoribonuclease Cas6 [Bacteroidetes bacterium]|nr:CRISPR-associated endoribonuclease Cas6 [Bacteroidota bacterium]
MRLKADFEMSTDWLVKDYRSIFMALIKCAFNTYDPVLYYNLYGTEDQKRKVNKPFTFSVRFPHYKGIEGNRMLCGNQISLIFSSDKGTLVTAFYNGLKENRKIIIGKNFPITFDLNHLQLLPLKKITTNKAVFKTISPILVNDKESNLDYLSPAKPGFTRAFKYIIAEQARQFQIQCTEEMIEFEINSMKKLPLTHYDQTMTSWLGEFVLEAPANVLQLVYDIGIGVRRSQGFGMLEIVKTY